ncbi:MAG: asparagine synthase (glutamine-hydrolyzing) [Deltaproteobacteria bacterium]|nr:asparagine synthase (glutamine-hydrolyzing) [Deltaproteobacteria bacterium]
MCGIVGFKTNQDFGLYRENLEEAVSCLGHRGPDDTGLFCSQEAGVGLGHRRLSVIDLSTAGHQPMSTKDGKVQIVHNGEIYNFKEIRSTLEGYGHNFHSNTDTEVVLKSYLQWGIDCLRRFIGMFAFVLWDGRNRSLFLARDRLGIKPLYYCFHEKTLLFASELKAMMAFKVFQRNIDQDAIPLFLHYQYIPAPRTIFKNTYKLLPGHYMIYDNRDLNSYSYWAFPDKAEDKNNFTLQEENEILGELDHLLTRAVSDRLISDVPLGALLSGGIDSSMVVALMQKVNPAPVRTFSIGFREPEYNEAPWASKVANHLGTEHTEFYVTPKEAMDVIPRLPEIYDEPFADSSAIPTYLVSSLARSQVTVALSGDGGDEQFSGYVRYWTTQAMATSFQRLPSSIRRALGMLFKKIPPLWVEKCYLPWREFLPQRFRIANFPDKWQKLITLMGKTEVQELYRMTICLWSKEELYRILGGSLPKSQYEEVFLQTEGWPLLSRLMRVDQKTYLPDAMLTKVDRSSMAASLEVRVPLLDHRVVEYTTKLPDSLKYRNGEGKYILRRLLSRYVPSNMFKRPKMGFGVPIDKWFRNELKDLLLDYLSPERLKKEGIFDQYLVEEKIKEHLLGEVNHQYRLWSLLMWEMWRERWL